ncbi:tetratricopeptide repeat-containing sensor histidine kinase [Algoriphagus algorifonticola]|uniref:tetratricopeptide repeat-containing sensor histidine kinase n=1 Tax=Algoriphagus algorifonticola TaxID=2593007 RepID=UPI0016432E88|nr:histidine kinase dimerization/phosphoacceptor domain -containing protein [Algoriphagus algorifonticola]
MYLGPLHHYLGNLEFYRGDLEAAKKGFEIALSNYSLSGKEKDAVGMAMNLGIIKERQNDYAGAISSYLEAIPMFNQLGDTSGVAVALENLGLAYSYKGDYSQALNFLNQADSVLKTNTPETADRWTNLHYNRGNIHMNLGNLDSALNNVLKGIRISERSENHKQINAGLLYLAHIYERSNDWNNWRIAVNRGRKLAEETNNLLYVAEFDYEMADYFLDISQFDSVSFYADKGLEYFRKNQSSEGLTRGLILKGRSNFRQEKYREAIRDFEMALKEMKSEESRERATIYHNLGTSYAKEGEFELGEKYLNLALDLRKSFGQPSGLRAVYYALSNLYEKKGDFKKAYEAHVNYSIFNDSLLNETRIRQLAEIQTAFDTEQKDQEIEVLQQEREIQNLKSERQQAQIYLALGGVGIILLVAFIFYYRARSKQKSNELLMVKNEKIKQQSEERELLLKEIHHRVKNNLQIISSLLNMQSRGMSDHKMIDAMKESQSRVKTMALIHEKLYQYDSLSAINMKEYFRQLSDFLTQTYRSEKRIEVIIVSENIDLDIDTAVPLGLITNELLSNALKYAFTNLDSGIIEIKLKHLSSGKYELIVSDTGVGLKKDLNIEKSPTLGLRLVRTLTRQINGEMKVKSSKGTTFYIQFDDTKLAA